ncbi:hypothetical protein CPB84DRAFT_1228602 [Gymnopilus junonius]|uniref:Uncharacterized protein n=1 Tax=Gymnopilus junonius TaxID=109634 RepID=A0A9P5NW25_GYMJU|nr:hypothetical protein CPB84DRAFT_1228602 [Gymnopilus junonius]
MTTKVFHQFCRWMGIYVSRLVSIISLKGSESEFGTQPVHTYSLVISSRSATTPKVHMDAVNHEIYGDLPVVEAHVPLMFLLTVTFSEFSWLSSDIYISNPRNSSFEFSFFPGDLGGTRPNAALFVIYPVNRFFLMSFSGNASSVGRLSLKEIRRHGGSRPLSTK